MILPLLFIIKSISKRLYSKSKQLQQITTKKMDLFIVKCQIISIHPSTKKGKKEQKRNYENNLSNKEFSFNSKEKKV